MARLTLVRELFELVVMHKKYWMIPVLVVLLLLGLLIVLTANSAIAPFIYTVF